MLRRLFILAFTVATAALLGAPHDVAAAAPAAPPRPVPFVDVIEVGGAIDPVLADFIRDSVESAVRDGAQAIVIQLDSPGTVLSESRAEELRRFIADDHRIPITVWVGPSRARARGFAARLAAAADLVGVAPGTRLGDPQGRSATEALADGTAQINAPVLGLFVTQLDGRVVEGKTLDTARRVTRDGRPSLQPYGVRFAKLSAVSRLLHTVTNPTVAYLLIVIGLALMVFEFYTGGVGVAAGVGVLAFSLSAYGLGNLPTRPGGLALLLVAMLGFAIDVQAGTPRFWTGVGSISLVGGSLLLYADGTRVPVYWIAVMVVMTVVFMVAGMPTMVRTRFSTPTVGRQGMIGELGEARSAIDPEGVVAVRGAPWRARTNRATPILAGDAVKVVAIDGLLLEVEPLEGAARDAGH